VLARSLPADGPSVTESRSSLAVLREDLRGLRERIGFVCRRGIVVIVVVVGIGVGAFAGGLAGGEAGPPRRVERGSSLDRLRVAVGSGLSVRRSVGWRVIRRPLTSVIWPVQRLVIASFTLRQARPDRGCGPTTASRELPPGGALLFMSEYTRAAGEAIPRFRRRPARFRLDRSTYLTYECSAIPSYMIRFGDAGREFQVQVYLGAGASARTRAMLLAVLDSLKVQPIRAHRHSPGIHVRLGGTPLQVISALGSVWVSTCQRDCSSSRQSSGQLVRVDSHTGRVAQRIAVADLNAFAVGDGAIWIAHFWAGTVSRLDPRTGRTTLTSSLELPARIGPGDHRFLPSSIGVGAGAVWVATARGWLARIDPRSGHVVSMVRAPLDATGQVVVGRHAAWVAESSLGVGVVRSASRRLKLLWIRSGTAGAVAVDQVALGGGRVWAYGDVAAGASRSGGGVATNQARIVILAQRTGKISRQLRFPAGPYQIAYGNGALFAANYRTGQLFRIDASYRVEPLQRVHGPGTLIAVTPGAIWATTASRTLRRIDVRDG
jgi:streptogramin lyase